MRMNFLRWISARYRTCERAFRALITDAHFTPPPPYEWIWNLTTHTVLNGLNTSPAMISAPLKLLLLYQPTSRAPDDSSSSLSSSFIIR